MNLNHNEKSAYDYSYKNKSTRCDNPEDLLCLDCNTPFRAEAGQFPICPECHSRNLANPGKGYIRVFKTDSHTMEEAPGTVIIEINSFTDGVFQNSKYPVGMPMTHDLNYIYSIIKGLPVKTNVASIAQIFDINYEHIQLLSLAVNGGLEDWQALYYCLMIRNDEVFCNFCSVAFNLRQYRMDVIALIAQTVINNYRVPEMSANDISELYKYVARIHPDDRLCYAYDYCRYCVPTNTARIFTDAKISYDDYLTLSGLKDDSELSVLVAICSMSFLVGKEIVSFLEAYIKRTKVANKVFGVKEIPGNSLFDKSSYLERLFREKNRTGLTYISMYNTLEYKYPEAVNEFFSIRPITADELLNLHFGTIPQNAVINTIFEFKTAGFTDWIFTITEDGHRRLKCSRQLNSEEACFVNEYLRKCFGKEISILSKEDEEYNEIQCL